ncbi:MAG: hypothetical protein IPP73_20455 [Chitinophagaceae bacterium]|nr:hypothetical protein [Chitinophagaceae bacterium]
MKKYCVAIALIFIAISAPVRAQHISGAMQFSNPVEPKDSNQFGISYSTLTYFRDYEYFKNEVQTGYTEFGSWHYPRLVIQPAKGLKLEAGALIKKDFGEKISQPARAMFSLQFRQKNWTIILGALESSLSHGLVEPLMGYDKAIDRPIEEGFQLKFNNAHIESDLWLDWSVRQYYNSDFPEELSGGLNFRWRLTKPGNAWQVKIPLQFVTPHKGGELDTNHAIVSTVFNSAMGLTAEYQNPNKNAFLKSFKAETFFTGYYHAHESNLYPKDKGSGLLANVMFRSKYDISFLATLWNGKNYIAPLGAPIYQSISYISGNGSYFEPTRKLLMLNLMYDKEIFPHFYVDARVSPFIDLKKGYLEHSFLIFFSYKNNFMLGKLKK